MARIPVGYGHVGHTGEADRTSTGPIAIQIRRSAEVLGHAPESMTRAQREASLAEALAYSRLHLAAPINPSYAVDGGGVASAL